MIEAFEIGVALTLETDEARSALSAMGQQLSTLNQELRQFQNDIQAMPSRLDRLEGSRGVVSGQNSEDLGKGGGRADLAGSSLLTKQQALKSVANVTDYLPAPWDAGTVQQPATYELNGVAAQTPHPGLSQADTEQISPDSHSDGKLRTYDTFSANPPNFTGMFALMAAEAAHTTSRPIVRSDELHSFAASILAPVPVLSNDKYEPDGRPDRLVQSNVESKQSIASEAPRASVLGAMIDAGVAEIQGLITSASLDKGNILSITNVPGVRDEDAQRTPMPEGKFSASLDASAAPLDLLDAVTGGTTSAPEKLNKFVVPMVLNEVSGHSIYDVARAQSNATAVFPTLRNDVLAGESKAADGGGAGRALIPSSLAEAVPPAFPQPKDISKDSGDGSAPEALGTLRQNRSQDEEDANSFTKPVVIQTDLHLDGDIVARVVSERIIKWMNGPLSGTGGFDPRRSYTPVES